MTHVSDELTKDQIAYLHERAERRRGIWREHERGLKEQVREPSECLSAFTVLKTEFFSESE